MVTEDDEICKIGLVICRLGLKIPSILCANAAACLCFKAAASLPFDSDYVSGPLCAICCVQLYPEVGFMNKVDTPRQSTAENKSGNIPLTNLQFKMF